MKPRAFLLALVMAALAACGSSRLSGTGGTETPTPTPSASSTESGSPAPSASPSASPTSSQKLTVTRAKIRLNHAYDIFWCDPDQYPVGRPEEQVRKQGVAWYNGADKSSEEIVAIKEDLGLAGKSKLSDDEKFKVYQEHKKLASISVTRNGNVWHFSIAVNTGGGNTEQVTGSIDDAGKIRETGRKAQRYSCPICLSGSTLIDTPDGPVQVRRLSVGMKVYTTNRSGTRIVRSIGRVVRRPAAPGHLMLRLTLADGRVLIAAPRHPAADGRALGSFEVGDRLDGSRVKDVRLVASPENATYDLLPNGPTGDYWANGILIGSTLSA